MTSRTAASRMASRCGWTTTASMQHGLAARDARGEDSRRRGSVIRGPAARPNPGEIIGSARPARRGDSGSGEDGQQATLTTSSGSGVDQRVAGRQCSVTRRTDQQRSDDETPARLDGGVVREEEKKKKGKRERFLAKTCNL
ncbi:hypothetical protein Scep_002019 [Stephania cephalantha]|uniref:Uncharacterized protein n=1 Tax=Stephania cephalantha TaxID=152367 RepID=A0AAP0L991_9MAGN